MRGPRDALMQLSARMAEAYQLAGAIVVDRPDPDPDGTRLLDLLHDASVEAERIAATLTGRDITSARVRTSLTGGPEDLEVLVAPARFPLKRRHEKFSAYWQRLTPGQVIAFHAATVHLGITPQSAFTTYVRTESDPEG